MKIVVLLFSITLFSLQKASAQTDTTAGHQPDSLAAKNTFFQKVEIESEFPGGAKAWLQFLNEHLKYPKKAVRKKIEGTVLLQFIVDKDGSISDLSAVSGDPILVEAALAAMKDSPNWRPATQNGKRVKSYKKQPIHFKLVADTK
jgi:protein TonB